MTSDVAVCFLLFIIPFEIGFLLKWHVERWVPKVRQVLGISREMPSMSAGRLLSWCAGMIVGVWLWVVLTRSVSLHPVADFLGKMVSLGVGEVVFLALYDGWLIVRERR